MRPPHLGRRPTSDITTLPDTREDGIPLPLILVAKLLAVPPLLLPSPDTHLSNRKDDEQHGAQAPIHQRNANPGNSLKHVVRAGDQVEANSLRDTTIRGARASKVLERDVRAVVACLADNKQRNARVCEDRVRGLRGRTVGAVCPVCEVQARHDPVVSRVLVDVADGHGRRGEAVHEEGLILALGEVDDAHEECELLQRRGGLVGGVEERPREVHERVDQKRAEVLDNEDGAPGDLRTCASICERFSVVDVTEIAYLDP